MEKQNLTERFFLITIVLFAVFSNIIFFRLDNSIKGVDSPNHLFFSLEFFYSVTEILSKTSHNMAWKWHEILHVFSQPVASGAIYWPNGLNANAAIFYSLLGTSFYCARLSLLPYLIILIMATYGLGKRVIPQPYGGVLSSFLLFMYPLIFQSSRHFQLDFPLTAMVALTMFLLLQSELFTNRIYCVLSAVCLGWAMLIKGQAILFISIPLFFMLVKGWQNARKKHIQLVFVANVFFFFLMFFMLLRLWWGGMLLDTFKALSEHIFSPYKASEGFIIYSFEKKFSLEMLTFYIRALCRAAGHLLFGGFLVSLFYFLKVKNENKTVLLMWIIIPFLLFSIVFTIKESRLIMPILPAMSLITCSGILMIRKKFLKKMVLTVIIIFTFIQFLGYSCNRWAINNVFVGPPSLFPVTSYETIPIKRQIKIDSVCAIIRKYIFWPKTTKIGIIACGNLETMEIIYWLKLNDRFLHSTGIFMGPQQFMKEFDSFDVILFIQHNDDPAFMWPDSKQCWETIKKRHPVRIERNNLSEQIPKLIQMFKTAKNDFKLIGKVEKGGFGYDCYYVFLRNDNIIKH